MMNKQFTTKLIRRFSVNTTIYYETPSSFLRKYYNSNVCISLTMAFFTHRIKIEYNILSFYTKILPLHSSIK